MDSKGVRPRRVKLVARLFWFIDWCPRTIAEVSTPSFSIKVYWNTALPFHPTLCTAFMLQWQSGVIVTKILSAKPKIFPIWTFTEKASYVQCFLCLVSSSVNVSVSYYMAQYLLDRPHILGDLPQPFGSSVVTLLCRTGMNMADATTEMGFLTSDFHRDGGDGILEQLELKEQHFTTTV